MDIERAKELFKMRIETEEYSGMTTNTLKEAMIVVLNELEKKDKVINEMSTYVNSPLRIPEEKYCEFYNSDEDLCWKTDKECKECIKEYFTKKVEGK